MDISPEHFVRSSFIKANETHIFNLIQSHSSLMFEGPRGCGKTTFITHLLLKSKFPYIKINSILGEKKHNFIKILWTQLKKLFGYENPNHCVSLQTLARNMAILKTQVSYEQYSRIASQGVVYIFIDNIEELHVNQKFLSTLFGFRENIELKIAFILSGINANSRLVLYENPICDTINIIIPKPDKTFILTVVINHLKGDFMRDIGILKTKCNAMEIQDMNAGLSELISELQKGQKLLQSFAIHIVEGIYLIESDLEHIKRLSMTFMKKLLEKYQQIFTKFYPSSNSKTKPEKSEGDKIRLARILNDITFKNFFNKVCEYGSENAWIFSKKEQEETIEDQYFEKKVFYPELLKTSIFFAEVCPEVDDYRRFKEYKRKTKKPTEMKTQKAKVKKHNPFRVMSISESLESQTRMQTKEKNYQHHSMDYYTCFQYLQEEGDIKFLGKSGAFSIGKIQSRTNEQEAIELLRNMDLKIEQFKR